MAKRLGIYIHIPFCASKCSYCDFYSLAGCEHLMPEYHKALLAHLDESAKSIKNYEVDSIYFGGGTPSFYGADRIIEIFNALKLNGNVRLDAEVTIEVNPDSISLNALKLLREEGVNRLSIGVQASDNNLLKLIGRRHNFQQAQTAVANARKAGFDNVSLDLIYGLPSQMKSDWAQTLAKVIELHPEHLSCYGLKLEPGTKMYEDYYGSPILPDDDEQADMYCYAAELLERYVRDLKQYIAGVGRGVSIVDEYETIEPLERAVEYIMLGMRTAHGISERDYRIRCQYNWKPIGQTLQAFAEKGWAEKTGDRWHFTVPGYLISNTLIGILLEAQAGGRIEGTPWLSEVFEAEKKINIPKSEEELFTELYNQHTEKN